MDDLQCVLFYTKVFVSCILDFFLYDLMQRDNNNGQLSLIIDFANLQVNFLPTSGWRVALSKGANFNLKPVVFWIYNTHYLVLCGEMIQKSMSFTLQKLSKHSKTFI